MTELRTAVDAVRALASMSAGAYSDPTLSAGVTNISVAHITDLQSALDPARAAPTLSATGYGETLTAGVTTIKASHIDEIRNVVK